jgi:hypothetical protein
MPAQASQRLREHTAQALKVKPVAEITLNFQFNRVPGVRRGRISGVQPCEGSNHSFVMAGLVPAIHVFATSSK